VNDPNLLSFKKGDRISLTERYNDGWCHGELNGRKGMLPLSSVKLLVDGQEVSASEEENAHGKGSATASVPSLSGGARKFSLIKAGGEYSLQNWLSGNVQKKRMPQLKNLGTLMKPATVTAFNYSPIPIKSPLLSTLPEHHHKMAVENFRNIMRFMNDLPLGATNKNKLIKEIMLCGIQNKELQDEIYLQIIKQINENPIRVKADAGYRLLLYATNIFAPSTLFIRYVQQFLLEATLAKNVDQNCAQLAKLALGSVNQTFEKGSRLCPPCQAELNAVNESVPLTCRVEMLDGETIHMPITSQMTAADLTEQIFKSKKSWLSQENMSDWGIWEKGDSGSFFLCPQTKLCDAMAAWDNAKPYALYTSIATHIREESTSSEGTQPQAETADEQKSAVPASSGTLRKALSQSDQSLMHRVGSSFKIGTMRAGRVMNPIAGTLKRSFPAKPTTPNPQPRGIFDTLRLKSRQSGNGKNEGMHTFSFQFRRHYWKSDEIQSPESLLQKNKVMSNFFFHQMAEAFLEAHIPLEESLVLTMAALLHRAKLLPQSLSLSLDTVGSVLPTDLLDKKDLAFWVQRIQALFPKYERLQPEETKTAFIRGFVSSPLYGGIAFPTLTKGPKLPPKAWVMFTPSNVLICEFDSESLLAQWDYSAISQFTKLADGWLMMVGDFFKSDIYTFQSPWVNEVSEVYHHYAAQATI